MGFIERMMKREATADRAIRDMQPIIRHVEQGWQGIEDMPDEELSELRQLATKCYLDAGELSAPDHIRAAWWSATNTIHNEQQRRVDAKTGEILHRDALTSKARQSLRWLAESVDGLAYVVEPRGTDQLLGTLPPGTRITDAEAQAMDDEELTAALERNRQASRTFVPFARDADAIEISAKQALLLAKVLRKREKDLEPLKEVAHENLATLNLERDRRKQEAEDKRRAEERMRDNPLEVLNDLAAQIEELRQGK